MMRLGTTSQKFSALSVLALLAVAGAAASGETVTEYPIPTAEGWAFAITAGPDGNLWFTEYDGNKIGTITTSGVVTEYSVPTPNSRPNSITAGPDGNLWFTERSANKIGRITTAGAVTEFSIPTPRELAGITAGPDGNLWFTEYSPGNIGRITTGGVVTEYSIPTVHGGPYGITAGPDGNLWFTELAEDKIGKITTSGVITEYSGLTPDALPEGITAGPDGNLWFAEYRGNRIGKITTSGVVTEYPIFTSRAGPVDITLGPDGNLWFAENGAAQIGRVTTGGGITEYPVAPTGNQSDITLGPDGNLWFAISSTIGKVVLGPDTPTGSDVTVPVGTTFFNTKTSTQEAVAAEVILGNVTGAGSTTVTATSTPTDLPPPIYTSDIGLCSKAKKSACETDDDCPTGDTCTGYHGFAFDLSTTAAVSGPITICSRYHDDEKRPGGNGYIDGTGKPGLPEQSLRLLHEESGVFVDVTLPGYPDTLNNVVCGQVNSLSTSAAASAGRTIGTVQGAFGLYVKTDMPGNGSKLNLDCMSEWSLGNPTAGSPTLPKKKRGTWFFPDAQLTCKAGSAKCNAGQAGFCKFRFRVCLNANDSRLPCKPTDVKEFQLLEPKLADPPTDNDSINAQRMLEKLGGLAAGDTSPSFPMVTFNSAVTASVCTDNIEVTVPANGVAKAVRLTATDTNGRADFNYLKLLCNP